MVKLVFFADLHLDAPFAWLGGSQLAARRRRQALRETLRNIVRLTREVEADALLCGGDLFEQARFTPDTVGFLERTFQELDPIQVFLAPGNHDWYGPESPYRHADWSSNVHVFHDDRLSAVPLKGGVTLWGGAHTAPARTLNFFDGFQAKGKGAHIALFHGAERGAFPEGEPGHEPHAPFYAPQIEAAGLHHALVGHYHRPRDAERYTYPGNPDFLTFGEDGERGAVILSVASDGTVARERRRVGITEAHDLTLSISGCITQQDIRDRLTALLDERTGVARVTVEGELDPRVDLHVNDLLEVPHVLEGIQVRLGRLQPAYDLDRIVDEPTVRGQFVRDVMDAVLDEEDRRRVLLVGLRALEGRGDLEPLA
ncbi:MAG: metallophosphoesterase [Chloroflexi bacterium]|nr:metallophosphoesterase [Chloroflexota bacterium]